MLRCFLADAVIGSAFHVAQRDTCHAPKERGKTANGGSFPAVTRGKSGHCQSCANQNECRTNPFQPQPFVYKDAEYVPRRNGPKSRVKEQPGRLSNAAMGKSRACRACHRLEGQIGLHDLPRAGVWSRAHVRRTRSAFPGSRLI